MRDDLGANMNLVRTSTDSASDDPGPWKRRMASAECDDVSGAMGVHADELAGDRSRATPQIDIADDIETMMKALNAVEQQTQHFDYLYDDFEFVDDISKNNLTTRWRSRLGKWRLRSSGTERCTTKCQGPQHMDKRSSAPNGWMLTKAARKGVIT